MLAPLPPDQEVEAQQLAQAIATAVQDDLLRIARTLVATDRTSLFGATEFTLRDLVLGVAATAYEQHLAQKKTATTPPGSPAPTAAEPPLTTTTANARSSVFSARSATAAPTTTAGAAAPAFVPSTPPPASPTAS